MSSTRILLLPSSGFLSLNCRAVGLRMAKLKDYRRYLSTGATKEFLPDHLPKPTELSIIWEISLFSN